LLLSDGFTVYTYTQHLWSLEPNRETYLVDMKVFSKQVKWLTSYLYEPKNYVLKWLCMCWVGGVWLMP